MRLRSLFLAILGLAALAGCGRKPAEGPAPAAADQPPHGGTVVVLSGLYRLELVRDAADGRMDAYVLDSELEDFIRIADPSFEVVATVGREKRPLSFQAVANFATGEKVGATSAFSARAGWLKDAAQFDAVLTRIDVRGNVYANIAFNFPRGNGPGP